MNLLTRTLCIALSFAAATAAMANDRPEVVCKPEVVDAATGRQALVCRYRVTDGTGKEIMIEDASLQGDVGSIGVAL
ncbi:MAG: hypothetical protein IPK27_21290 [Rhodanobacteraceae bacterium]|nr:hypothetical protein [Rhodanobacteraceae bacterium]